MIIDKIGFWTSQMWKTFLPVLFIKVPYFDKMSVPNALIFHSIPGTVSVAYLADVFSAKVIIHFLRR
ncbi:hypothetical protein HDC90_003954 [Pedobacter sp. AK013]|uniref:hypothetical protein n=1 Tax=Pedobacter sp. AK013 TaxID=2723071 RepID=UPI00160EBEB6|nr:hypothetical protein [Pedobacter sp. AK013]MBB6239301.1 hypothetical protein [Pedobacter sp. AK013]